MTREILQVKMLIGGQWRAGQAEFEDVDPYRHEVVARVPESTLEDLSDALNAAVAARPAIAAMPAYERAALLRRVGHLLVERADWIAEIMARETGKAIKDAKTEVLRSQDTIALSAEEAVRIEGEHVPLDSAPMGVGKLAMLLRFPVGVVAAITPFNAPFNLACHKVAPAIAAGNAVVLKPPSAAPAVVHALVELFVDAGTPPGVLNVVYGRAMGPALVRDPRVDFITFTGSGRTGRTSRPRRVSAAWRSNSETTARRSCTPMPISKRPRRSVRGTPCGWQARAASPSRTSTYTRVVTTTFWSDSCRRSAFSRWVTRWIRRRTWAP